ncbi:MAG: S9 family peptidase [Bacteroidales bacterium]
MEPPIAQKQPKELIQHNDKRIDPYYWMRDRDNPDVLEYLRAENSYTRAVLENTGAMQDTIFHEIVGRIKPTDMTVPYFLNGYYYYTRYEDGKEYPVYCRKKGSPGNEEEVMLDGNAMAEGHDYFMLTGLNVSPDNTMLSYGIDTVSRRKYTLYVKDLETGEVLPDRIPNTTGHAAWGNDNQTLFYTLKNEHTLRPEMVFRHTLGNRPESDEMVFHEKDETYTTVVFNSKSRQYILIGSFSTLSTEYRYLDAGSPAADFQVFQPRQKGLEYFIKHYKGHFYIRTNYHAQNFRFMKTPVHKTRLDNWEEVIPHRDDVLLEDFEIFRNFLAINERREGLTHIRIMGWDTNEDYYLEFNDPAYVAYFSNNPEFDTDVLRYGYTSLTIPTSIYDHHMKTREKHLMKRQEVLGGYCPEDYTSERVFAVAGDGMQIPVSMVYKKGLRKDGTDPMLLVGYGSYGNSYDPFFSPARLSLLDRGFIFAIAHVRGGEEMGRQWYEDGKLLNKKNTFTDFIACARHLVHTHYTSPERLFIMGGSAGGLLIGAVINMEPDLFRGAVAAVPFVDVVTTMLDESIPLTTGEYDEWGDPRKKEHYDHMLSYSPYDNVTRQDYPNLLVTTGLHDSQVQYWEPAKWVAKLRDMKTDDRMLLLWTNMEYGHGGASGRFRRFKETAMEYAFMLNLLDAH